MAKATVNQRLESNRFSGALAPLNNPNYRLLLLGFAIGQMIMPLQFITQILWSSTSLLLIFGSSWWR